MRRLKELHLTLTAEHSATVPQVAAAYLVALPVWAKAGLAMAADAAGLALAAALAGRLLGAGPLTGASPLALGLMLGLPLPLLLLGGTYRVVARFAGIEVVVRLLVAVLATGLAVAVLAPARAGVAAWRQGLAFTFVAFTCLLSVRLAARWAIRSGEPRADDETTIPVLIYGAGAAGHQLAQALARDPRLRAVAFADDDPALAGRTLAGLPVWPGYQVARRHAQGHFAKILIAIPSLGRSALRYLLERLESLNVEVLVMPSLRDIAAGTGELLELREVRIEDLLDRDPVPPVPGLLDACIRGRAVMVTGAGGSIGAELCRQIVGLGATRLVLFEASEFALYAIAQELAPSAARHGVALVPVLATVLDRAALARSLAAHGVATVYHAAAYKHVPLVEANAVAATRNNVFGTLYTVQAALAAGAADFVLVSTDKAVRPTNIMGATKRVCELIVQALAAQHPGTRLSMVRFGNVLASSGSVVPLFRDQLARGGPLTVTHPEVTRYFMTIPEAAELVIQAGAMGAGGEVYVLDMGEPVRIMALAERMIHLSGRHLRQDPGDTTPGAIAIACTGLRPGEKLYEELLINGSPEPTPHPRIFKTREDYLAGPPLLEALYRLDQACEAADEAAVEAVFGELVNGFRRAAHGAVGSVAVNNEPVRAA